ncbi:MAG: TetR family transcriptional regulator, partial [Deltaproteobacteria bacterium]|nr:TetR family transcriptional regulator [Deltaproteobacteria bacterium]
HAVLRAGRGERPGRGNSGISPEAGARVPVNPQIVIEKDPMAKRRNPQQGKLQSREKLLQAAKVLFGSRGYHGTTIEEITQAAGVTRGALYWHFESKAHLLGAVIEELRTIYLERFITETAAAGDSPMEKLWYLFKFNARFAVEHPNLIHCLRTLSLERHPLENENSKALFAILDRQRSFITKIIREAQKKKMLRKDLKAEIITSIILAVHDGIVLQLLAFDRHLDGREVAWALRQITLAGITVEAKVMHPEKGRDHHRPRSRERREG